MNQPCDFTRQRSGPVSSVRTKPHSLTPFRSFHRCTEPITSFRYRLFADETKPELPLCEAPGSLSIDLNLDHEPRELLGSARSHETSLPSLPSVIWHASLASGLRTAYSRVKQLKRPAPPRPSQTTGPERTRLAVRICHHWYKLEHSQWGSATPLAPREILLRRLRHVRDASVTWGTANPPPEVTPGWDTNGRSTYNTWTRGVIPTIHRFLTLAGVTHVKGKFCTHPPGTKPASQLAHRWEAPSDREEPTRWSMAFSSPTTRRGTNSGVVATPTSADTWRTRS